MSSREAAACARDVYEQGRNGVDPPRARGAEEEN